MWGETPMSDPSVDRPAERRVPYFSQWESAALAPALIAGVARLEDDPLWAASGAQSVAEYAAWANRVCGMACLKMILAARSGRILPTIKLARGALRYGAYASPDAPIQGLIYAPFVTFVAREFGLHAEVVTGIEAAGLPAQFERAEFFIASVHPSIRFPRNLSSGRGGHLVLVTAAHAGGVTFHNPSGHGRSSRVDVRLPVPVFDAFFAGRGIAILPA